MKTIGHKKQQVAFCGLCVLVILLLVILNWRLDLIKIRLSTQPSVVHQLWNDHMYTDREEMKAQSPRSEKRDQSREVHSGNKVMAQMSTISSNVKPVERSSMPTSKVHWVNHTGISEMRKKSTKVHHQNTVTDDIHATNKRIKEDFFIKVESESVTNKPIATQHSKNVSKEIQDADNAKNQKETENCFRCKQNNSYTMILNQCPMYPYFTPDFKLAENKLFQVFFQSNNKIDICNGKIQVFWNSFALLKDVILHPFQWNITGVIEAARDLYTFKDHSLRTDEKEILKPKKGLLDIYCPKKEAGIAVFNNQTDLSLPLLKYLKIRQYKTYIEEEPSSEDSKLPEKYHIETRTTFIIQRKAYANFYHMMLHSYNIFIMLIKFQQQPCDLLLVIMDNHPKAEIDDMMRKVFGPITILGQLRQPVRFKTLIYPMPENRSPLGKWPRPQLPHLEEFRDFILQKYGLKGRTASELDCRSIGITFIWRRDKVFHPRNLKGTVERKIFNELELHEAVSNLVPQAHIEGLLLDSMPMKDQLQHMQATDILIAMHGAGLTHTFFLPPTSALIELFPYKWKHFHHYYKIFEKAAKWRNLHYTSWENTDPIYEMPNYFTVVNVDEVLKRVELMVEKICK